MFTNKGKPAEAAPSLPDTPTQRRSGGSGRGSITSIIANGVKITGSIEADGAEVQVDGEIDGNMRGGAVTVGDTGMVKGDIIAESVTVHGRVEGSVRARRVQLQRNAHVLGDIVHQSLSVEMGAVFEGQCRYLQDPLRQDGPGTPSSPSGSGSDFGGFGESHDGDRMASGVIVTGSSN